MGLMGGGGLWCSGADGVDASHEPTIVLTMPRKTRPYVRRTSVARSTPVLATGSAAPRD
jgi:hypothetical protein